MASTTVIVSDLSGEPQATTRIVTVGEQAYEVDLTAAEFAEYQALVDRYVRAGRPVAGTTGAESAGGREAHEAWRSPGDVAAIKTWAVANGWAVPKRGRLGAALIAAYQQSGSQGEPSQTSGVAESSDAGRREPAQVQAEPDVWAVAPLSLAEMSQVEDRVGFVYVERAIISRDESAITATDDQGTVSIPAATISALLVGPGTSLTHQAMMLLAEGGVTCVWTGEQGVRYYAHGRGLSRSARLIEAQARLVANERSRLAVARRMFEQRYPGEDVARMDMQRLRGMEGIRMRQAYAAESRRTGVAWSGRVFDGRGSDTVNQALSAAATCLYGVAHSVITALGASPDLGFVHSGNDRSFVYDIADLYRADIALPVAFDVAREGELDVQGRTRRAMRDKFVEVRLLRRCVADVLALLLTPEETPPQIDVTDIRQPSSLASEVSP